DRRKARPGLPVEALFERGAVFAARAEIVDTELEEIREWSVIMPSETRLMTGVNVLADIEAAGLHHREQVLERGALMIPTMRAVIDDDPRAPIFFGNRNEKRLRPGIADLDCDALTGM